MTDATTDPLVAALQAFAAGAGRDAALTQGILTLGGLRTALRLLPDDMPVALDTGGFPGEVDSYRGYYERLAFATVREPVTAREVVATLDAADGATFYGYKGGDYVMGSGTFLHVAEYSVTGRCVTGVRIDGDRAVIETADEDW